MLRKAHEIQQELSNQEGPFQEELRKKKICLDFDRCGLCGGEIAFFHMKETETSLIEEGQCRHCREKLAPRRYKIQ